jgi:hypothetical protein
MDKLTKYRKIITKVLTDYASIPYYYGELKAELIISKDENRYLIITSGWENKTRVHACIIHIDIIDDKIWIQSISENLREKARCQGVFKEKMRVVFLPFGKRSNNQFSFWLSLRFDNT